MKSIPMMMLYAISLIGCQTKEPPKAEPTPRDCPFPIPHQIVPVMITCGEGQGRIPLAECVRQCEESNTKDTTNYCEGARRAFYGKNELEMQRMYTLGCEKGRSEHCVFLADSYVTIAFNPQLGFDYGLPRRDPIPQANFRMYLDAVKRYGALLLKRCEEDHDQSACTYIAMHYQSGGWPSAAIASLGGGHIIPSSSIIFREDREKAIEYRKRACEYGSSHDCHTLAIDAKDPKEARTYMACACDFHEAGQRSPACKLYEDLKAGKPLPK